MAAWTRWYELVAANDRGHVRAMKEAGATQEEIRAVRAADRQAQGVTAAEEHAAEAAIKGATVLFHGRLTVVRLPHERTSPVADKMEKEMGGAGYENLLVVSPRQVNFFGSGSVIRALDENFPGGWYGGSLPERGFWGGEFESKAVIDQKHGRYELI